MFLEDEFGKNEQIIQEIVGEEYDVEVLDTNIPMKIKEPEYFDLVDSDAMVEAETAGVDDPIPPIKLVLVSRP